MFIRYGIAQHSLANSLVRINGIYFFYCFSFHFLLARIVDGVKDVSF